MLSHGWIQIVPRSYCHPTQPICKQISPKSKLFAHFSLCTCGLCPRVEWQCCTFGRRLCMGILISLSFKDCPYTFPRSYCHPTQPICKQISPKSKLFAHLFANVHIFLYLCTLIWNGVLCSQQIRIPIRWENK